VSRAADRAFEEAVARLVPLLLRYFARRVTPTDDAADCTSETLLSNYQRGCMRRDLVDQALRAAAAVPASPIPDEAFIAAEALRLLPERD